MKKKTTAEEMRSNLLRLILEVSFERKPITLSSGKQSDFYLDLRTALMRPQGQQWAGSLLLDQLLAGPAVDAVGGMAVGAVPVVTAVLSAAAQRNSLSPLVGFFVRKEAKGHGKGRRLEGNFAPGQSVALLEDTCTTGGSTLEALNAVEEAGGKVVRALCIVNREEGASEAFAERGIVLESLFTRRDLPLR